MSEILPNLWLGSKGITYDHEFLTENSITHIVTVLEDSHRTSIMTKLQIQSLHIPLSDNDDEPIGDYFPEAVAFIGEALRKGGAVYIHCFAGVSRSPTIVAAYLIHSRNMSLNDALNHIFERRSIIDPNDGFRKALAVWESKCKSTLNNT